MFDVREADVGEPGRVFDGLLDIPALEIGVAFKNFLERGAVGDLADDHRYGNPHPANAGPSSQNHRVERDAVELQAEPLFVRGQTDQV